MCSQYTLLPVASGSRRSSGLNTHPQAPRTPQKFVTRSLVTLFSSSKSVIRFSLSLLWNPVLTMNCGIRAQSFPFSLRAAPSCSSYSSRFGLNVTFLEKPLSPCSPIPSTALLSFSHGPGHLLILKCAAVFCSCFQKLLGNASFLRQRPCLSWLWKRDTVTRQTHSGS